MVLVRVYNSRAVRVEGGNSVAPYDRHARNTPKHRVLTDEACSMHFVLLIGVRPLGIPIGTWESNQGLTHLCMF